MMQKGFHPIHLDQAIDHAIATEKVIGTSIIIAKAGDILFEKHTGWADREAQQPVTKNTLFRLASLTKPLTSSVVFQCIEQGLLSLDSPVTDWLPHFKPKAPDGNYYPITIRHLLTHTSGLGYGHCLPNNAPYASANVSDGLDNSELSLDENIARIAALPLLFKPGDQWLYSLSTEVLGAVLEKATKQPLPQLVQTHLTRPLAMEDTCFYVNNTARLAQAYKDNPEGGRACLMGTLEKIPLSEGKGTIYLAPGRALNSMAYPSGGAGMQGTARDYLKFLEAIRQCGAPILTSDASACLTQDAVPHLNVTIPGPGYGFGMGFGVVRDATIINTPRPNGSYAWLGAYGGSAFVDPSLKLSVVILTNTAFYGLQTFQEQVTAALYKDLL